MVLGGLGRIAKAYQPRMGAPVTEHGCDLLVFRKLAHSMRGRKRLRRQLLQATTKKLASKSQGKRQAVVAVVAPQEFLVEALVPAK